LPWLWIGILALLGVGLFVARSGRELPRPVPTSTVQPRATPPAAAAREAPALAELPTATSTPPPTAKPTAAATHRPSTTPTPLRASSQPSAAPTATVSKPTQRAVVALTFDAGADRGYTEDILDLLRTDRVSASFGITGQWARANPDMVKRMAAEGHMVFNHTLDHQSFTGLSDSRGGLTAAARRAELDEADVIIAPLIGHSTRPWYRLPYGDDDARVAADVAPSGYSHKVGWSIDTLGWRGASAADIVDRSLRLAARGAIYVLHVGHTSQDGPALARIVTGLRERSYGFVTVEQLAVSN
jgi:peptidoglycan-N-acetylglucosamine deacetylase